MTETSEAPRRTLDPKLDLVFNLLFGSEPNRRLLLALLNDVLRPPTPIVSVQVLPSAPETRTVEDKLIFLDLRVRLQSGEQIDVEMQTRRHTALRPRLLFYWGRMYTGQLKRGENYASLQRCVVVLVADFEELPGSRFHSVFQARERTAGDLLTDHLELHLLELPKLRNALAGSDEPALAAWCRFLAAETDAEREALAMQHPILREAKDALDRLSADPDVLEAAERRESELWFYEHGRVLDREQGRAEGHAEGSAKGRVEGKQQALLRLLAIKFGELPVEHQARIATSTEADLDRWLDRCLTEATLNAIFSD